MFDDVLEQQEAKGLLRAALLEGPAHAYLFHGPPGVGKHRLALRFAAELLGDRARVERGAHPDVYELEPLGDQIRIDEVRALRRDLHMRPFEAHRRVYVIRSAQSMNAEAADALLKDLEEPPDYAVIVMLADELGPIPETIRSRCQLVPFGRLSEKAVRSAIAERAPDLDPDRLTALARIAGGRLDRAERLIAEDAAEAREAVLALARGAYADPEFDVGAAAGRMMSIASRAGSRAAEQAAVEWLDGRELELRKRRAAYGAERETVLEALEELAGWYRDLVAVAAGAERVAVHVDHLPVLRADASPERLQAAERAAEIVRETWRTFEELNLQPRLALEAMFVRLRRELAGHGTAAPAGAS